MAPRCLDCPLLHLPADRLLALPGLERPTCPEPVQPLPRRVSEQGGSWAGQQRSAGLASSVSKDW